MVNEYKKIKDYEARRYKDIVDEVNDILGTRNIAEKINNTSITILKYKFLNKYKDALEELDNVLDEIESSFDDLNEEYVKEIENFKRELDI